MKFVSPQTPFSMPFATTSKILKVRLRNIMENITEKYKRTPIPLLIFILLFCFFSVNLVSCTSTGKDENFGIGDSSGTDILTPPGNESILGKSVAIFTEFSIEAPWESKPTFDYNDQWTFSVEEIPADDLSIFPRGVSSHLVAIDKLNGETQILTDPFSANLPGYRLARFTDILGCDGFVFEYSAGAVSTPMLFFCVNGDTIRFLASCDGTVYTSDLDENGVKELIYSTYGAFPFTFVYSLDKYGTPISASLDDVAKEALFQMGIELPPDSSVTLDIQHSSNLLIVHWLDPSTGEYQSRELDASSIFRQFMTDN